MCFPTVTLVPWKVAALATLAPCDDFAQSQAARAQTNQTGAILLHTSIHAPGLVVLVHLYIMQDTETKRKGKRECTQEHTDYLMTVWRAHDGSGGDDGWNPNADKNTRQAYHKEPYADDAGQTPFHRHRVSLENYMSH